MNKCKKHPRYKGIRPPKCGCKDCIKIYVNSAGLEGVLSAAVKMSNILFNMNQDEKVSVGWREHARMAQSEWDIRLKMFKEKL